MLQQPGATGTDAADVRAEAAASARRLLRTVLKGSLATLDRDTGAPYVSMVNVATDWDGSPVLLLSDLARHTRNGRADARASLLLDATDASGDPASGARLTLTGRLSPTISADARVRYLEALPSAAAYVDFGDFGFWRLDVESGHFIGGFGRILLLDRSELIGAE